jgi:hypothetical protein
MTNNDRERQINAPKSKSAAPTHKEQQAVGRTEAKIVGGKKHLNKGRRRKPFLTFQAPIFDLTLLCECDGNVRIDLNLLMLAGGVESVLN